MFCHQCGTSIPDNSKFCVSCGKPVEPVAVPGTPGMTGQPVHRAPFVPATPRPPFNDYLIYSILTTLCCCLPLGVIACAVSASARKKYELGDYAGAQESAKSAKLLCIISVVIGIILYVLPFVWGIHLLNSGELQRMIDMYGGGAGDVW